MYQAVVSGLIVFCALVFLADAACVWRGVKVPRFVFGILLGLPTAAILMLFPDDSALGFRVEPNPVFALWILVACLPYFVALAGWGIVEADRIKGVVPKWTAPAAAGAAALTLVSVPLMYALT